MVGDFFQPEQIEALLYEAGRTHMALRVPGCWPAGYRSSQPVPSPDADDLATAAADELSVAQPSASAISAMDRALAWINRLPWATPVEVRARKLVLDRMRVSPRTGKPVFNWSRLGARHGVSHTWAKTIWLRAIEQITAIANAPLPASCANTIARIRAMSTANRLGAAAPAPLTEVQRLALAVSRRPAAPCAQTLRRIAETSTTRPVSSRAMEMA